MAKSVDNQVVWRDGGGSVNGAGSVWRGNGGGGGGALLAVLAAEKTRRQWWSMRRRRSASGACGGKVNEASALAETATTTAVMVEAA